MRKWQPPDTLPDDVRCVIHQIVAPVIYRKDIVSLAHDTPKAGHLHLGAEKSRVLLMFMNVVSCVQMVRKPNQKIVSVPL